MRERVKFVCFLFVFANPLFTIHLWSKSCLKKQLHFVIVERQKKTEGQTQRKTSQGIIINQCDTFSYKIPGQRNNVIKNAINIDSIVLAANSVGKFDDCLNVNPSYTINLQGNGFR